MSTTGDPTHDPTQELTGSRVDPDVVATIREVVGEAAERGGEGLWQTLSELGLARLTAPEDAGGSGATWRESAVLIGELAAQGVPSGVGESDLLAGWLLRAAGLPEDGLRRTVAVLDEDPDAGSDVLLADAVAWAAAAERVVCVWPQDGRWLVADIAADALDITAGSNLADEPRDTVAVDPAILAGAETGTVEDDVVGALALRAALLRAVQVAGSLEACVALAIEHVTTRRQFGRPLAAFQAVQHLVADMAAEATLARAAVDAAVDSAASREDAAPDAAPDAVLVAVARSCAGHAASVVVRHAHQLHGALGTTREHVLHRLTLPALAWRAEHGTTEYWDLQVAAAVRDAGPDGLWPLVTGTH